MTRTVREIESTTAAVLRRPDGAWDHGMGWAFVRDGSLSVERLVRVSWKAPPCRSLGGAL